MGLMEDKLRDIERKYDELAMLLGDPVVLADNERLMKYAKARAELE
jgi:protein subunit release factor A